MNLSSNRRTNENRLIPIEKKFCVELAEGTSSHYRDMEIFGPGFLNTLPPNTRLRSGTKKLCGLIKVPYGIGPLIGGKNRMV